MARVLHTRDSRPEAREAEGMGSQPAGKSNLSGNLSANQEPGLQWHVPEASVESSEGHDKDILALVYLSFASHWEIALENVHRRETDDLTPIPGEHPTLEPLQIS